MKSTIVLLFDDLHSCTVRELELAVHKCVYDFLINKNYSNEASRYFEVNMSKYTLEELEK